MKTVKFYTLGCKVNQYETQVIREQFEKADFQELENSAPAQICVINTCTVTHRADRSSLYLVRRAVHQNPHAKIIVTGCLTQFDADKIAKISGVSAIVKNKDKSRIVSLLNNSSENRILSIEERNAISEHQFGTTYFKNHNRAFLKIQDGCDYHCSYCKVSLVRGQSRSRALNEVKKEICTLVKNGYLEIVLSGICLGAYGRDLMPRLTLAKLIKELEDISGHFRIRLSSIEVNDVTDELIEAIIRSSRLCRHLHIPLQSGDREVLSRMNRSYSPEYYLKLIERIRCRLPDIAITTDVMVGFPGETEANFMNTVELIKNIQPLRVHIFPYSKRTNTLACGLGELISEDKLKLRIANLGKVAQDLRSSFCQRFVCRVAEVLIERPVEHCSNLLEGYTDNYIKVRVKSGLKLKNQIIQVRLIKVYKDFVLADTITSQNRKITANRKF